MYLKYCLVTLSTIVLAGCSKLKPDEFIKWFENPENGFIKEKQVDSFLFRFQYRPNDLMALTAFNADPNQKFSLLESEFSDAWYFRLNICEKDRKKDALKTNLRSEQEYFERVLYLSETIKSNAFLILENLDTVRCLLHSYERTYNINPCQTLLFSFPKSSKSSISKMIIMDHGFTGKPVEILFDKINEANYPKLNL